MRIKLPRLELIKENGSSDFKNKKKNKKKRTPRHLKSFIAVETRSKGGTVG